MTKTITINRAPVLCLWASVVARRLGFNKGEALSLAKGITGLTAQSKGRRLGIFTPKPAEARKQKSGKEFAVEFMGRHVPCINTDDGVRHVNKEKPVTPESVKKYLAGKFGDDLGAATEAMEALAKAYKPSELGDLAFGLYAKFRPSVPAGTKGWGAKGELDLGAVLKLGKG